MAKKPKSKYAGMGTGSNPASKAAGRANMRPISIKPGECLNPKGSSAKQRAQIAQKAYRERLAKINTESEEANSATPLQVIEALMNDDKVSHHTRLSAAKDLSDRFGGKPSQTIEVITTDTDEEYDPSATVEEKADYFHQRIRSRKAK